MGDDPYSYTTERKLKIIRQHFGPDWAPAPTDSIDAIYAAVIGDTRKNLFCKISAKAKAQLDEIQDVYNVRSADLLERWIEMEYNKVLDMKQATTKKLVNDFSRG